MTFNFRKNTQGCVERVPDPRGTSAATTVVSRTATAASAGAHTFDLSMEDCVLPPPGAVWGFREQTSAWADKIAGGLSSSGGSAPPQLMDGLRRMVRGALMHKDVYREAAATGSLTQHAVWVAVGLIVISNIGLRIGSLLGYDSMRIIKSMLIQAVGWAGAVYAVHWIARTQQQLNVPPLAWFRAMAFAQSALVLSIVPVIGPFSGLWVLACMLAALQDVSGKDFKAAILLMVTAGIASAIIASVLGSLLF